MQCCQALPPLHLMVPGPEAWLCSENRRFWFFNLLFAHIKRSKRWEQKQTPQNCTCRTLTHIGVSLTTDVAGSRLLNLPFRLCCPFIQLLPFPLLFQNCTSILLNTLSPSYRSVSKLQLKGLQKCLQPIHCPNTCVVSFTRLGNKKFEGQGTFEVFPVFDKTRKQVQHFVLPVYY